jgi:hypothetical protein
MMMITIIMAVMAPGSVVSAAFGLERSTHPDKIRSEAMEHVLDHMVGPNAKNLVLNFSGQMSISQVPSKAHKLIGIFMSDFNEKFGSRLDLQPSSIIELQAISIRHCDRFRKIEEDLFALVSRHPDATAMARVKVERQSVDRFFLRPMPGGAMDASAVHLGNHLPIST